MSEEERQQIDNLKAAIIFKPGNEKTQEYVDVKQLVENAVQKLLTLVDANTVIQILKILEGERRPALMLFTFRNLNASQLLDAIKNKYYSDES